MMTATKVQYKVTMLLFNQSGDKAKEPMSAELLKHLCGWLLDYGTTDGMFAYCYLLITWNLMCRSESTAILKLTDIVWSTTFDAFQIHFSHSKIDQIGDEYKNARHVYANSHCPLSCPVLALSMYFSSCFNTQGLAEDTLLFPGPHQEARFSKILTRLLRSKRNEVRILGFDANKIGTHSIRKGASSYLSSLPGGPSAAAINIQGGWSMVTSKIDILSTSKLVISTAVDA